MDKLPFRPDAASYAWTENQAMELYTPLPGGFGRSELDLLDPTKDIACQWTLNIGDFATFIAFYETWLLTPLVYFPIDLVISGGSAGNDGADEYMAKFADVLSIAYDGARRIVSTKLNAYKAS